MIQPGDEFEVTTNAIAHGGASVGRHEGQVIFVRDAVPGERLRVRVDSMGKGNRFAHAHVLDVLEPSSNRRDHPWPMADALVHEQPVGGADYGHIRPEAQLRLKSHVITEQLTRLGGVDQDSPLLRRLTVEPLDAGTGGGWRTRVHWAVDEKGRLGMHPYHGSEIIPVSQLPFAVPEINNLHLWEGEWRNIQRVDVAAPATGLPPLILFTAEEGIVPEEIVDDIDVELATCLPAGIEASAVIVPASVPGRQQGEKPDSELVRGGSEVYEEVPFPDGTVAAFRVGAGGFWQNHKNAPQRLARIVEEASDLQTGETAWDLYGGAGLLTAALADRVGEGGTVWSVEGSPVTAADSEFNFGPEGASRTPRAREANVVATKAGVEQALRKWDSGGTGRSRRDSRGGRIPQGRPDVIVLDPPRQGAGRRVMEALAEIRPRRIVYVACDPAALGRDTGYLRTSGWELTDVQGLDMYPDTHHVETIAVFEPHRN
ncbi:class I SAM-dependent RNA methyltransferase [Rothia uropygialis]|uniref:class I SAM-dependent RNA methyltransferase n=1 Tax=Kocuria sp. 36 TaxID=1415402 RepID=UPI00101D6682|nr:TRAM domain-containing protein [Kocuria sp. 36]